MADNFLPDNYDVPQKGGNYMRFKEGSNRFRILSKPVIGFEAWEDKQPTRFKITDPYPKDAKHFWALVVYNYDEEAIQILTITQKTIMSGIRDLSLDPDWGSPMNYDIVVNRVGKGLNDTEYTVQPKPAKALDTGVVKAYEDMHINLNALFTNGDPFANSELAGEDIAEDAARALG